MAPTDKLKDRVKNFWDQNPCGSFGVEHQPGSWEFFEQVEESRYRAEPFIHSCAQFSRWRGKKVLEVGFGMGSDHLQFARAGAELYGVDLAQASVELLKKRLELYGLNSQIQQADAEKLPFPDDSFDLVYSWGVIHHTPDTQKAVDEIIRVTKPGGKVAVMIYHKYSWVALMTMLRGVRSLELFTRGPAFVLSKYTEHPSLTNPLTKAYGSSEAKKMFSRLSGITVEHFVTPYDLWYCPNFLKEWIPPVTGWFMVIKGTKPLP